MTDTSTVAAAASSFLSVETTVTLSLWTATLTAIGWIVSQYLSLWRDDRSNRLQFTIEHAEKQITEFYAPLIALFEKLATTAQIKKSIMEGVVEESKKEEFNEFVYYNYFIQQHEAIQRILSEKIHLLDGWDIPASYNEYLKHYTSENIYNNLLYLKKSPYHFKVWDYPDTFKEDLKRGLVTVLREYEDSLAERRTNFKPGWLRPRGSRRNQNSVAEALTHSGSSIPSSFQANQPARETA